LCFVLPCVGWSFCLPLGGSSSSSDFVSPAVDFRSDRLAWASSSRRCGFAAGLPLLVGGGASLFGLRLLWFVFLLDLVQLRSVSQRRWRNWVVRRESSTADVLLPRISCGLPSGVTFLVWLRGSDGGVACCSATVRMEQRNNREERRKKKRDLFVISDFCRDPSVKRVSTVLDLCFILM